MRRRTPDLRALPLGALDPQAHPTLERGLRGWVTELTGLKLGYVEQLYTFGDRGRDPAMETPDRRLVSISYLALTSAASLACAGRCGWSELVPLLPLGGLARRPAEPGPRRDNAGARRLGGARPGTAPSATIGATGSRWRSGQGACPGIPIGRSTAMNCSMRRAPSPKAGARGGAAGRGRSSARRWRATIAACSATAISRLRGKLTYRPVVFELIPESFTLLQLQKTVETLAGIRLHKQNFRRLVDRGGLVEPTGARETRTGGRPAEHYRFRRKVLSERPAPGVGLPERRT